MPSLVSSSSAPMARSCLAITAKRSVSLTRSSAASRITLVPSAQRAATERIGISSTSLGIRSPPISKAFSGLWRTRRSATGSPATSRWLSSSSGAPICSNTSRIPVRVGLMPTFSIVSSAPGTTSAAINQNAAELMSPGTTTCCPCSCAPGCTITVGPSAACGWLIRSAPKARSMRSLWSRESAGSITVVLPLAVNPASSKALLTWALATGVRIVPPLRAWPAIARGALLPPSRPLI